MRLRRRCLRRREQSRRALRQDPAEPGPIRLEPRGELGRLAGLVEQALPVFEAADDDVALCLGHNAFAFVLRTRAQLDRAVDEYERAAEFAARAGLDDRFVHERSLCRFNGTTPASELLAWQDGLNERDRRGWEVRQNRAVATGMLGRIDEALAQLSELQAELAEQRATMVRAVIIGEAGVDIEFLAGDYAAAATLAEESCTLSEELGEEASLWGYAAYLALAYCDLGRLEEADAWASRAAAADTIPDPWAMMWWRQARAKVLARRGDHAEAERVAREAVAIGERTDALDRQASVHAGLAEVLFLAGRTQEAAEAFEQALARYERKGNLVMVDRMRVRLAEIATPRVGEALATGVDR